MKLSSRALFRAAIVTAGVALAAPAAAGVVFYSGEDLQGKSFATDQNVRDLERYGLARRVLSFEVDSGRWEVCDDADFGGRCVVVGPGQYKGLPVMGIERVVSVRAASS
nr:beta/Gamma crystallin [uncultured bacterium]